MDIETKERLSNVLFFVTVSLLLVIAIGAAL